MFERPNRINNICANETATTTIIIMSSRCCQKSCQRKKKRNKRIALIVISVLAGLSGLIEPSWPWRPIQAVSVQRLTVPDLVVVDQPAVGQLNQPSAIQLSASRPLAMADPLGVRTQSIFSSSSSSSKLSQQQPEAASLINSQDLSGGSTNTINGNHEQLTFECLISYDRKKDKNLIIKWHHDDRVEPIYQWIVELDKISIAPQYKPYILANNSSSISHRHLQDWQQQQQQLSMASAGNSSVNNSSNNNQVQLLEASFRLIRPSKELGGKYTCSAISVQNDDSKWRKMIVFTPPRSFKFNATRTDFGQQQQSEQRPLMSQRAKQSASLPPLQLTATNQPLPLDGNQHQSAVAAAAPGPSELPLAYRSRGFDGQPTSPTISAQMYKTIDYVNVNPNYRPSSRLPTSDGANQNLWPQQQQLQQRRLMAANGALNGGGGSASRYSGVKLVCDIDQIFPVPEVSIYRLASVATNGSHPMDKLTKSETKIEKNPLNGLYHIQVISVLLDDEIELKYGPNEPVYFECLIGLTNLELSKYSDNKRSFVYRRSPLAASSSSNAGMQNDDNSSSSAASSLLFGWPTSIVAVYGLLITMNLLSS